MKSITRFKKNKQGITCLNCEQPISDRDKFCSNCGQVNDTSPLSLKQYFSEYLAGFFSFDNRFLKTLFPLLFKPGKVTKEYVEGKRMRYVNPFQLYLHVTIVFFLILGVFNKIDEYKNIANIAENQTSKTVVNADGLTLDSIKSATLSELEKIDRIEKLPGIANTNLRIEIDSLKNALSLEEASLLSKENKIKQYLDSVFANSNYLEQLKDTKLSKTEKDSVFNTLFENNTDFLSGLLDKKRIADDADWNHVNNDLDKLKAFSLGYMENVFKKNEIAYEIPDSYKKSLQDEILENVFGGEYFKQIKEFIAYGNKNKEANVLEALDAMGYEKTYWNIFYYTKAQNLNKLYNDEAYRKSYGNNIVSKISVALFFLLPIFTLIVCLLYLRNPYNYTEHLVFVFHVQTVFFIFFLLQYLFDRVFDTDLGLVAFIIIFPIHLYIAMMKFYMQGWFKTLTKYFILNISFGILALLGGIVISFLAFLL